MTSMKGGALEIVSDLFRVLRVPRMGRGIFAMQTIPANTVVLVEEPLVSTPPVSKVKEGSWCPTCCSPGHACGHTNDTADMSALYEYCEDRGFKWPLLMAKLAKRALHAKKDDGDQTLERMRLLCSVNLEGREVQLEEQRQAVLGCLAQEATDSPVEETITGEWYFDMYARIQANAFRLDLIDSVALQAGTSGDYQAVLRAMLARQEEDDGGSAVYTVASLVNHSCVPNMDVAFPNNDHTLVLRTNQTVRENEQLTISYVDHEQDVEERARRLAMYGFRCECEKCREETADT